MSESERLNISEIVSVTSADEVEVDEAVVTTIVRHLEITQDHHQDVGMTMTTFAETELAAA